MDKRTDIEISLGQKRVNITLLLVDIVLLAGLILGILKII